MLFIYLTVLLCVQYQAGLVDTARILGVFPVPSISHQVVFRALMLELSKHGHELVIITPNPALPKDRPKDNITEIDTSSVYQVMGRLYNEAQGKNMLKKGVVLDIDSLLTGDSDRGMTELISYQFDIPEVKALLEDKTQKFDLIFVEAIANYHLIVTNIFKAPVIWFSSFYGFPEHYNSMGAVAWHPTFYPYFYRQKYVNLTIWERIREIYLEWRIFQMIKTSEEHDANKLRQRFGPDIPSIDDMKKNIDVMFVNSHPLFASNRPVPSNVVYLGALHLQKVKDLPEDLQSYLDNSSRGVIYVSFGSNVRPSMMDSDLLEVFLETFKLLPFDILWKFDYENLENVTNNVKIQKWFPQRDLLRTYNIYKLNK
ncbi:unnamed protein product [Arctia plantaginis]|uniref:UDP-glycosyltransferase n=1 Tax=Arctia plantaginis TaxID=874455 RepID=A0A8S0ZAB7_ARCPL|nr:unnamed protein product [Arctia plantaginis]